MVFGVAISDNPFAAVLREYADYVVVRSLTQRCVPARAIRAKGQRGLSKRLRRGVGINAGFFIDKEWRFDFGFDSAAFACFNQDCRGTALGRGMNEADSFRFERMRFHFGD
jgi:hypothetical protein